jgi:hypothetical protein
VGKFNGSPIGNSWQVPKAQNARQQQDIGFLIVDDQDFSVQNFG